MSLRLPVVLLFALTVSTFLASFGFALAAADVCAPQNIKCTPEAVKIKLIQTCIDRTKCMCVTVGQCKGISYTDQQGQTKSPGDAGGFQEIMKQAMGMLQQLMQAKQQKQPPPPPPPPSGGAGGAGGPEGCTQYYQVTAPSTDKCAYYVPPTSSSLLGDTGAGGIGSGASDALTQALSGGDSLNVSDALIGSLGGLPEQTQTESNTEAAGSTSTASSPPVGENISGQQVNLQSGTRGDIVVSEGGATIVAQARDAGANTEVAGFYGSDTFGGQPQGIISGMCQSRPWGSSIVSFVIPPAFFDSLCAWRGYQVGSPAPPSQPVVEQPSPKPTPAPAAAPASQTQTPTVPPQVDIWAVPEKVPLGTRTSVFWNTKGVESCSVTSPDGSFNEDSLSGGAATVPLSGPTTFTISCLTAGGTPVTDYVTVQLAI
ncbi:hypothetical protein HYW59_04180 [Candidatus Kaiserbacteria bacterium]|nr:hypothetical protein [Candidatus Kaiserbacteria bacterium]